MTQLSPCFHLWLDANMGGYVVSLSRLRYNRDTLRDSGNLAGACQKVIECLCIILPSFIQMIAQINTQHLFVHGRTVHMFKTHFTLVLKCTIYIRRLSPHQKNPPNNLLNCSNAHPNNDPIDSKTVIGCGAYVLSPISIICFVFLYQLPSPLHCRW